MPTVWTSHSTLHCQQLHLCSLRPSTFHQRSSLPNRKLQSLAHMQSPPDLLRQLPATSQILRSTLSYLHQNCDGTMSRQHAYCRYNYVCLKVPLNGNGIVLLPLPLFISLTRFYPYTSEYHQKKAVGGDCCQESLCTVVCCLFCFAFRQYWERWKPHGGGMVRRSADSL